MPRVIISSGHTAANPGVIANGLNEFEVARKIAKNALKYIRLNGIISLSVPPNMELAQRIEWINRTGYMRETNDIAIEVHINDSDGTKSGLEGWYEGNGGNPSHAIASQVLEAVNRETGLENLGTKSEFTHELGSIAFVHELAPHSIIIEIGFIDNESDANFLKDDKQLDLCGRGIAKGILNYYGLEYREAPVPAPMSAPVAQPQYMPQYMQQPAQQASYQPAQSPYQQPPVTYQPAPVNYQQAPVNYMQQPVAQPAPQVTPAQVQAPAPVAQTTAPIATPAVEQVIAQPTPVAQQTNTIRAQSDDYDDDYDDYDDDTYDLGSFAAKSNKPTTTAASTPAVQPTTPTNNLNTFASSPAVAPKPAPTSSLSGFNPGAAYNGAPASTYTSPTTSVSAPPPMLSREERKALIIKNYNKILGREPNQNDLNYFLNIGVREDELIKKMVDSQEHADLVKSRQEVITMKKQFNDQSIELNEMRVAHEDQKAILDSMQSSISQKNTALENVQNELREAQLKLVEIPTIKSTSEHKKYKGSFMDKLFKAFSDLFE